MPTVKNKAIPQCDRHGYDYRICCEECQEKCKKAMEMITKTRKVWQK